MSNAKTLLDAAEAAVAELEAIEAGEPWGADSVGVAAGVVAELREHAAAEIFPQAVDPADADTIASYKFHTRSFPQVGFGQQLAALHGRCIDTHPALAEFLLGSTVVAEVSGRAADSAAVLARKPAELAAETVVEYQVAIATCLHGRGELEPAAGILADTVPALQLRIDTVQQRHDEHAASEKERQEQALTVRRGELVEQFRRLGPNHKFSINELRNGARIGADEVAGVLTGGMWDMHFDALEEYLATLPAGLRDRAGVPA